MRPDEVELLQHAGQILIHNASILVSESVLYGLYLAIFVFGIRALLYVAQYLMALLKAFIQPRKKSPWTKYTWILFSFLSILCLLLTLNLAIEVAFNIQVMRGALVNNPEKPLIDRFQITDNFVVGLRTTLIWLGGTGTGGGFTFIIADAVVVWRAYVLWPGNTIARFFPLALLFTGFGSAVVSSTLATFSVSGRNILPASSPAGVMIALTQSLSLATNVVATMLIGYKAYHHRRMMKISMGLLQSSKSLAILMFLTESGAAFCILQVITLATNMADDEAYTPLDYVAAIWMGITLFAAAAYPFLVLIIIENHRSIADSARESAGDSGVARGTNGIGSHLSFAAPPRGNSSSGDGVAGEDSILESRVDPQAASVGQPNEGSVRVRDLERGEGLPAGTTMSD